jgi:hypothetical protein
MDGRYTDYLHITDKWPGTLYFPMKFIENLSISSVDTFWTVASPHTDIIPYGRFKRST